MPGVQQFWNLEAEPIPSNTALEVQCYKKLEANERVSKKTHSLMGPLINRRTRIYIPPWWKRVSREGIQTRTNFSFRGRNFHFPRSDSCLPSEARLDSLIKEREKFSQGKKSVRDCNFLPRIRFSSMGDTFSSQFWTCSTISHNQIIHNLIYEWPVFRRHLWMPPFIEYYRSLMLIL